MKMKHVVTFKSGMIVTYEFKTKSESFKALKNAKVLSNSFNTIKTIAVFPVNFPERKYVIGFDPIRIYEIPKKRC